MAEKGQVLAGTRLLDRPEDTGKEILAGLSRLLDREIEAAEKKRCEVLMQWSGAQADGKRTQLARYLGVIDERLPIQDLDLVAPVTDSPLLARTSAYDVMAVRWPVLSGVDGEGLLLSPHDEPVALAIAIPDADLSPEMIAGTMPGLPEQAQFARRLVEMGCQVVVPELIDRACQWSGNPDIRLTNQPHREYVYRMAYQMGRHVIGYEVQKVLALVDFYASASQLPVVVFGYGEGGMLALYSAAIDDRIAGVGVSGYFGNRFRVWQEPIYRNVWRLLRGFSDAELAACIAPRPLVVEASSGPSVQGPPASTVTRSGAAPGVLSAVPADEVRTEIDLARQPYDDLGVAERLLLIEPDDDRSVGTDAALSGLLRACGIEFGGQVGSAPSLLRSDNPEERLKRQFYQLCEYTQQLWRDSANKRRIFWQNADPSSVESWTETVAWYRRYFRDEVIGQAPPANQFLDPQSRLLEVTGDYDLYEVVIEVWDNVPAFAYLLIPHGIASEKRPVVVCQHGLGGNPRAVLQEGGYKALARRLAAHGYVVLAPQNPSIGPAGDEFRVLQRKANPLGCSLFSFIATIHEAWLGWLSGLSFVDRRRIALYGLSYGGKTALRVPALLEQYAVSICSGDFNEWIMKTVSTDFFSSYMFTGEYEIFEFGLGESFNHAEMVYLIAPRPFMVERGHDDACSTDEWVAFEYAKVRYLYDQLRIGDRTDIEFFAGGHQINLEGTLEFLDRHLGWSRSAAD